MYPYRGGIAHFMETMRSGLQARGHEVLALSFTRQYPGFLFPGTSQLDRNLAPPDLAPAKRAVDSVNPVTWLSTSAQIARADVDAVVFKYWMPFMAPAFGTIARRLARKGVKTIVVVDNALPHERHLGDAALSRYFLGAASGFVVMSESVRSDLEMLGIEGPARLVQHPVYDLFGESINPAGAREQLGLPEGVPVLLFFGFIRRYKGLHVLLEAMPHVLEVLPEAQLVVAGECYDDEGFYRDIIQRHRLERSVKFDAAYIANADVPKYFSAADVVVQPYVSATQSGVAQVAFNFSKPLIVTNVGGLTEVVHHEDNGLVVPPEAPGPLAEAVIRYFQEGMKDRLTENMRQRKEAFGWNALYEAIESLI